MSIAKFDIHENVDGFIDVTKKSKFTFKTEKPVGKWRAFDTNTHHIKLDGMRVGSISDKEPFKISFMVEKNGTTITDNNPNCKWKIITLAKQNETLESAKKFIIDNTEKLLATYRFYGIV